MSEHQISPKQNKQEICPVHHGPDIEYETSKVRFPFLKKRTPSKSFFKDKQSRKVGEENRPPSPKTMIGFGTTKSKNPVMLNETESPLLDYKRGSAANSIHDENSDFVSVKSTNTFSDDKSKSIRLLFKSLRRNKSVRNSNSRDENEEKKNNVFGIFSKEKDSIDKASLPIRLVDKNDSELPLGTMDSSVLSTPSTSDTVIKLDNIEDSQNHENSFNSQQLNPYDFVYNKQTRSLMEDSLNFDPQTNKNMIKIFNILAKETLNPSRDLFNGYNLNDLSENILTMVKENNRSHMSQIKIYKDKITKQDNEIFHLKMKLAKLENQFENITSIDELPTETISNTLQKTVRSEHKNLSPADIPSYIELTHESTKIKQLHNSLRKLEETHAKLIISQDVIKKHKTKLEKQKEFLMCYKDNSINFMSFLNSRFKGIVNDQSLSEYTEYLKRFKTDDFLTNSMGFQTSYLADSKVQIDKFFNVIATSLIKDSLSSISKSIQTKHELEKQLEKAKEMISNQEKKFQQVDKNCQVALNPNISHSSIFVNEQYTGENEDMPADPLLGP